MASTSKVLNDQANGARLSRLLVNKGTETLRAALDAHVRHLPSTLAAELNANKAILQKLRYKVINPSQWKLLYPSSGTPDSKTFDVTLLTVLLRNICGLAPPASGWDVLPPDSDTSLAANIARIKYYRNQVHAHITTTEITDAEFESLWQKISKALIALGIPKAELDELKEAPLSPEEDDCINLLKDWCKREAELDADVKKTLAMFREEFIVADTSDSQEPPKKKKFSPPVNMCKSCKEKTPLSSDRNKWPVNKIEYSYFHEICELLDDATKSKKPLMIALGGFSQNDVAHIERKYKGEGGIGIAKDVLGKWGSRDKENNVEALKKILEDIMQRVDVLDVIERWEKETVCHGCSVKIISITE